MTGDGGDGLTDFGFKWGPAEVTRMIAVDGRGRVIGVRAPGGRLQIYVSEKGRRIRVWLDHKELLPERTDPE